MEVTLPDGNVSLEMTEEGYRILSTWLSCFMFAFSKGKSWGGKFTLKDFYVLDSHVRISNDKGPKGGHALGSMEEDIVQLLVHVKKIFCRNRGKTDLEYPPFLKNLTVFLGNLIMTGTISVPDKLFIETHVSCTTSFRWGLLILKLHRRYMGLSKEEKVKWDAAINYVLCPYDWYNRLSKMIVFKDMFEQAKYEDSNIGFFTLMKDMVLHVHDCDPKVS